MPKRERTDAQIKAEKGYEKDRPKKPVSFRLDADEMAELDRARGIQSRAEFSLEATLKAARKKK